MKKFLTLVAALAMVLTANAQSLSHFKAKSFLGGNKAVLVTNNTTFSYGDALIPYTNYAGSVVYSQTNLYATNSFTAPGTIQTNNFVTFGNAWVDVPANGDGEGNPQAASITVSLVGLTASTTGSMTFTFAQMLDESSPGVPSVPGTATANKFVFALVPTGTTAISIITNLPTTQIQGTSGWRLVSVAEPNNSAAGGVVITTLGLNQYTP